MNERTNQYVNLLRRDDGKALESKRELIHKWPPSAYFDFNYSQFSVIPNHFLTCALFGPKTYSFNFHYQSFLFMIKKTFNWNFYLTKTYLTAKEVINWA